MNYKLELGTEFSGVVIKLVRMGALKVVFPVTPGVSSSCIWDVSLEAALVLKSSSLHSLVMSILPVVNLSSLHS